MRISLTLTDDEAKRIKRQADKAALSFSSWIRTKLGLQPAQSGGKREGAGRPRKEQA